MIEIRERECSGIKDESALSRRLPDSSSGITNCN